MLLLHNPATLLHETVELLGAKLVPAYESPARIRKITESVAKFSHDLEVVHSPTVDDPKFQELLDLVKHTHDHEYLEYLSQVFQSWRDAGLIEEQDSILPECFAFQSKASKVNSPPSDIFARPGFYAFDMSSGIMRQTYTSIVASAGLAIEAIHRLQDGTVRDILALCRPPGHHCDGKHAGGYCYVNNMAVMICAWRQHSPDARIGVLDIDFHHGNGTQEIFYDDPQVIYCSIHGADEFPYYTGASDEIGGRDAIGSNFNFPLQSGSSFTQYEAKLKLAISALAGKNIDLLAVSLGFDTFHLDPLGSFKIYTEDYEVMARKIKEELRSMPAALLLEGGYSIEHLGANVLSFLRGWESVTAS